MPERMPLNSELVKEFVIACHGNFEKVKSLYAQTPSLLRSSMDWGEGDWENGLDAAGHMGNPRIAEFLLEKGAPQTIFCAAMLGDLGLVQAFVNSNSDVINQPGVHRISLIYHAALSGTVALAEYLEQHAVTSGKDAALHAAIQSGSAEMAEWLLMHGVSNVNVINFKKQTPLALALEKGNEKIAQLLREHGGHEY